jgi:murein DD-endopeptidase MepM/ murein hydrolase activator NlpD
LFLLKAQTILKLIDSGDETFINFHTLNFASKRSFFMFGQRLSAPEKVRVGDVLVRKGLITPEDLAQALLQQQDTPLKLGEVLIQKGLLSRHQLQTVLAEQRWRNWGAAALFTLGSCVAIAPKLISAHPVQAVRQLDPNLKAQTLNPNDAVGGVIKLFSDDTASQSPQKISLGQHSYPSLALNPNPTIASPLAGFCHPLNGLGYVSQGIRGSTHRGRMEYAYDLAIGIGNPVYAMRAGEVVGVQDKYPDTGGGADKISKFNYVFVEHDAGYRSAYIHLQQGFRGKVEIKAGDRVEAGQLIGYSGNSGWSSGPHLHIELQKPGSPSSFTDTVPFAVAGICETSTIARAGS